MESWKKITVANEPRRNPFLSLQNELDRAIHDFYGVFEHAPLTHNFENVAINPLVDIVDDKNTFKVEAEMPGVSEDQIKVSIENNILIIKAEKHTSTKDKGKNYLKREIGYGSYERHISLPDYVDADKAKASFKKGMLWIEIPKKAESSKTSRELQVEKVK